jgi:hypothetical protein
MSCFKHFSVKNGGARAVLVLEEPQIEAPLQIKAPPKRLHLLRRRPWREALPNTPLVMTKDEGRTI